MRLFKSYRLAGWQVSLLKVSMLALGLAVGTTWPDIFDDWLGLLWVLFAGPALYLTAVGLNQ